MSYKLSMCTNKGMVRDNNQDCARGGCVDGGIVWGVVCDGMGGAAGGNIASSLACDIFEQEMDCSFKSEFSSNSIRDFMMSVVAKANVLVNDRANADTQLSGMGTTLVACIIKNNVAHICHIGDSRAYRVMDTIEQITVDHSMVQMLVDQGQLTPEEAKVHPKRNVITRAVGINDDAQCDYDEVYLNEDEKILLCTDGLSGVLSEEDILQIITEKGIFEAPDALVEKTNLLGGPDNVTALIMG